MRNNGKKRRTTAHEKIKYYIDLWLSRGTFATIILLFAFTGIIVIVLGILVKCFGGQGHTLGRSLWDTLNHAFDPGVLSGDSGSKLFLFLMLLATILGVLFLAVLIGLVNDGIQGRVADLSKGIEAVLEREHVVILGFNNSTFIILGELIEAYQNQPDTRNVVVVMDQNEKTEMEDRIRIEFPDTGNLTIICRSGSITNIKDLNRCSVLTSKSIIIADHEDFETIKCILACTKILNEDENAKAYITSVIYRRENEHAARIAGNDTNNNLDLFSVKNDRLELLMMENTIAKIMTHTCRQNGLSTVFTELFNFQGHELYIARPEQNIPFYSMAEGKSIRQINHCLSDRIAIGIIQEDGTKLIGDPNTVRLEKGCQLILLEEDDETIIPEIERSINYELPKSRYEAEPSTILVIGCNEKLPYILREMCKYLTAGTTVYLASEPEELDHWFTDEIIEELVKNSSDSSVKIERTDLEEKGREGSKKSGIRVDHHKNIYRLLGECAPRYVLILVPDYLSDDEADEQALKLLLYCKHYKDMHPDEDFGITCEMRNIANQQLAQDSMASDFVISHNIASLMMSQIAENRELREIFEILLNNEGYEIYIKPAKYYFRPDPDREIDYYSIQDAAAEKGDIFLGYKKKTSEGFEICLNPLKGKGDNTVRTIFTEDDELVVLSEDKAVRA